MQHLTFEIYNRDFGAPDPVLHRLEWQVERYTSRAFGGPYEATITARGDLMSLWELLEVLRCPVQIRAEQGDLLWWGYVSAVDIITVNPLAENALPMQVSASLETMFNKVAVAYNAAETGGSIGERETTAWAEDPHSQGIYGVKELLASGGNTNGAVIAENARDTLLAQKRLPTTEVVFRQQLPSRATIRCFGWWQSLAWMYATVTEETVTDTAAQIVDMVASYGQFFRGVDCQISSNITVGKQQDGDTTALALVEDLLQAGTANKRRMLSYVDTERRVRIFEEPTNADPRYQHSDGRLYDEFGVPLRTETAEAGYWVRLVDIIPPNINQEMLANPDFRFVESCEYNVKLDQVNLTYRDALDPFEIGISIDG